MAVAVSVVPSGTMTLHTSVVSASSSDSSSPMVTELSNATMAPLDTVSLSRASVIEVDSVLTPSTITLLYPGFSMYTVPAGTTVCVCVCIKYGLKGIKTETNNNNSLLVKNMV